MTHPFKPKLLCVDTTGALLSRLQITLRERYDASFVTSTDDALAALSDMAPDMIAADLDGSDRCLVQFLARVGAEAPSAVRVLITQYPDVDTLMAAVNEGGVRRVVKRPCSAIDLLRHLAAAAPRPAPAPAHSLGGSGDKVRTIGAAAGQIGHDINNLTSVLTAIVPLVAELVREGECVPDSYLDRLAELGDRLREHGLSLMRLYRLSFDAAARDGSLIHHALG